MKITHSEFIKIVQRDNGDAFIKILSNRTFLNFLKEIDSISDQSHDYGYSDSEVEEEIRLGKYKFIGDLFEIFAVAFFIKFNSERFLSS